MPPRLRIFLAILALGSYAQILQAVLVREALVVFYGNEISLAGFYGSWLLWIGVGSLLAARRGARLGGSPLRAVRGLLLVLPVLLLAQILSLRVARLALDVSASELVPLGQLLTALFLVTAPSGLALGLIFPLACLALEQSTAGRATGLVARLYVADALGALIGGALFTWMVIDGIGLVRTVGTLLALTGLTIWMLRADWPRPGPWTPLLVLAGCLLALAPGTVHLERLLERIRLATLQPGLTLVDATETRYAHLMIARLGDQLSLIEDGQITESFPQPLTRASEAALVYTQADGPARLLLMGGFAGGLAAELLRYPIARLDQVEQDAAAFQRSEPHLPDATHAALKDARLRLGFTDGRRFIRDLGPSERYDLVVIFAQAPTSAAGNRFFTRELYAGLHDHLTERGAVCTRVSAASNYIGREVGSYAASIYQTLRLVFERVAIVPGDPVTFCASSSDGPVSEDPETLIERYRATRIESRTFPAEGFRTLLPARDLSYLRERLESAPAEINSDARPVSYYLGMLLWARLTASGLVDLLQQLRALAPWPFLLPPLVLVALWTLRAALEDWPHRARLRRAGDFALFALGLTAMGTNLVLLLAVQAQLGILFERIALFNGVLMTGLALGAGLGARVAVEDRAPRALSRVLLLAAGALLLLPLALDGLAGLDAPAQQGGYLLLALTAGLITGAGFPLAVVLAHLDLASTGRAAGLAQMADNFGGALGGLVTGALLVPLVGIEMTCRVLATLLIMALPPLLLARFASGSIRALAARGRPSLPAPWPALGWALTALVLILLGWHWLQRASEPGPLVRFDSERLAGVAGSETFRLLGDPFTHYRGWHASPPDATTEPGTGIRQPVPDGEPDTAVASSLAAAPEVDGFAGPLNLLVAIDSAGRLRGIRYLGSRETPSYIGGIQGWLDGLAGRDLSAAPLDLAGVDALSGATVTSRAALETIDRTANRLGLTTFGRPTPPIAADRQGSWASLGLWVTLVLLAIAVPVYRSGRERARLLLLAVSVAVLGVWLNTPVTEVDLTNLLQGHAGSPAESPQRWVLWVFIALSALLFGQLWCGCLCPFGGLQEGLSRLGRRLGLRRYPSHRVDASLRTLKFLLLAAMLAAVLGSGDGTWAAFDPMQWLFGWHPAGWMGGLILLVLAGSLLYVRFWCRYLCPVGAFLALSNKLALLQHLAPRRRFAHCDLGVREPFDVDCIRCNRCLTGRDTHLARGRPDKPAAPPSRDSSHRSPVAEPPSPTASGWRSILHLARSRDIVLIGLVVLSLILIGLHLGDQLGRAADQGTGGWRRIDLQTLEQRIESGELRDRRADWYHPATPDEDPAERGGR